MASYGNPLHEAEPFQESQGKEEKMSAQALEEFYVEMERRESVKRKLSKSGGGRWRRNSKSAKDQPPLPVSPTKLVPPSMPEDDGSDSDHPMEKLLAREAKKPAPQFLGDKSLGSTTPPPVLPWHGHGQYKARYSLHDNSIPSIPWTNHHLLPPGSRPQPRPAQPPAPRPAPLPAQANRSSPDISTPPILQLPLPLQASASQPALAGPNAPKTGPDNVDMLDGSDPWGMQWHHDGRYDVGGGAKNTTPPGSQSWNGTSGESPPQSQTQTRTSIPPSASSGQLQRRMAPSPLSQSTSAIQTEAENPKLGRRLSKRRDTKQGFLSLFGSAENSPVDDKGKGKELGDSIRTAVLSHPMPLGRRTSAEPTSPNGPGSQSQQQLNRRLSKQNKGSSQSLTLLGQEKGEKRLSVFGRLAKKLSIIRGPEEKRNSKVSVKRTSTAIAKKHISLVTPQPNGHGPRSASMPTGASEVNGDPYLHRPPPGRVPPPPMVAEPEPIKPEERPRPPSPPQPPPQPQPQPQLQLQPQPQLVEIEEPKAPFMVADARNSLEGRSSPELPELGRIPGLMIANPDNISDAESSPKAPPRELVTSSILDGLDSPTTIAPLVSPRSTLWESMPTPLTAIGSEVPEEMRLSITIPSVPKVEETPREDVKSLSPTPPPKDTRRVPVPKLEREPSPPKDTARSRESPVPPKYQREPTPPKDSMRLRESPVPPKQQERTPSPERERPRAELSPSPDGGAPSSIGAAFLQNDDEDIILSSTYRRPLERRVSPRLNPPVAVPAPLDQVLAAAPPARPPRNRQASTPVVQQQQQQPPRHNSLQPTQTVGHAVNSVQQRSSQQYQPVQYTRQHGPAPQVYYPHQPQYVQYAAAPPSRPPPADRQRQHPAADPKSNQPNPLPPPPAIIPSAPAKPPAPYTYITVPFGSNKQPTPSAERPTRTSARQRANSQDSIVNGLRPNLPRADPPPSTSNPRPRAVSTSAKPVSSSLGRVGGAVASSAAVPAVPAPAPERERAKLKKPESGHRKNASDTISGMGREWEVVAEPTEPRKRRDSRDARGSKDASMSRATAVAATQQSSRDRRPEISRTPSDEPPPSVPSKRAPPAPYKEDPPIPTKATAPLREVARESRERTRDKERDREKRLRSLPPSANSPTDDGYLARVRSRPDERLVDRYSPTKDRSSPTKEQVLTKDRSSPVKVTSDESAAPPRPPRTRRPTVDRTVDTGMVTVGKENWDREKMKMDAIFQPPVNRVNMSVQRSRTTAEDEQRRPNSNSQLGSSHTSFVIQAPGQPSGQYYNGLPYSFPAPPTNPLPAPPRAVAPTSNSSTPWS